MQKHGDGSLIGQKGIKYGLQVPGSGGQRAGALAASRKPAAPIKTANVFGDDDSDDDIEAQVARQAEKKRSAAKVQQMYEEALATDPSVFDYDGVYDEIQTARTQPRQQEKLARQSKYIAHLKEQAETRKREEDIRYERRLLKERTEEDALYEGKDKFVTSAYRKKLEEDAKWAAEQARKDEEDERNDVRKVGHMGNFYANLLTKNVAMGNAAPPKAAHKSPSPVPPEPGAAGAIPGGSSSPAAPDLEAAAAKQAAQLDKYELLRLEAEKARKSAAAGGTAGQRSASPHGAQGDGTAAAADVAAKVVQGATGPKAVTEAGGGEVPGEAPQVGEPQAAVLAGKRRNDDQAVMSARERYLARRKLGG